IDVSGNFDVFIKNDSAFGVRVEADENLQEYILTKVDHGNLEIYTRNNVQLSSSGGVKIYVSGPGFSFLKSAGSNTLKSLNTISSATSLEIKISGAGSTQLAIQAPKVEVDISGACALTLSGRTKDFDLESSGSTDADCLQLLAENTSVDISGSGEAAVFASVKLAVEISGSADVRYRGKPAITKDISGSGSLKKID
ncbi:MAG: head GIN domain-containing protein, partial [Chitinophagaceae bacterium]